MEENPYQSPAANIGGQQSINTGDGVSAQVVDLLARTRPWTLFVAILGFIGVAFMILGALAAIATANQTGMGTMGMITGVVYFAFAALYALPLIRLIQYSSAITQLRISPNSSTLEVAMDRQRAFWKTVGIMMLIGIVVIVAFMIAAFTFASNATRSYSY